MTEVLPRGLQCVWEDTRGVAQESTRKHLSQNERAWSFFYRWRVARTNDISTIVELSVWRIENLLFPTATQIPKTHLCMARMASLSEPLLKQVDFIFLNFSIFTSKKWFQKLVFQTVFSYSLIFPLFHSILLFSFYYFIFSFIYLFISHFILFFLSNLKDNKSLSNQICFHFLFGKQFLNPSWTFKMF